MTKLISVGICLGLLGSIPNASAKPLVGLTETAARNYTSTEVEGTIRLDEKALWEGDLTYTHTNSTTSGELSTANEVMIGATHFLDDANDWRGALDYWNDTINRIRYVGPNTTFTHNWFDGTGDNKIETWGLALDLGLNFYSADIDVTTSGKTVRRGTPNIVTKAAVIKTTQFHPGFNLEHAFFDEVLVPFVTAGHYFYSVDPSTIEAAVSKTGVRLSPASTAGVDSLVGGFIKNSWALGTTIALAGGKRVKLEIGRNQSATDDSWSTAYSVKVDHTFSDHWRVAVGWNHALQQGTPIDFGVVGLAYLF